MLAYTRKIPQLNIFLSLIGTIPLNSALHSRVATCSLFQAVDPDKNPGYMKKVRSKRARANRRKNIPQLTIRHRVQPKGYKGTPLKYETDYIAQLGAAGVTHPETVAMATDATAEIDDVPLECQPPSFWSSLYSEFTEYIANMKVRGESLEVGSLRTKLLLFSPSSLAYLQRCDANRLSLPSTLNTHMIPGDLTGIQDEWDAAPTIYPEPSNAVPHPERETSKVSTLTSR